MVNIFFLICQDQGLGVMGAASQSKRTGWCCWQAGRGSAWPVLVLYGGVYMISVQVPARYAV